MYQAIPSQLHYYTEEKIPKDSTGDLLYDQSSVLLQYLQNEFLIDRVAIARGFANGQGLLDTAMEMIDISMMFWIKRDQLMRFSHSFDWIVRHLRSAYPYEITDFYIDNILWHPSRRCDVYRASQERRWPKLDPILTLRCHSETNSLHRLLRMGTSDRWELSSRSEIEESRETSSRSCARAVAEGSGG